MITNSMQLSPLSAAHIFSASQKIPSTNLLKVQGLALALCLHAGFFHGELLAPHPLPLVNPFSAVCNWLFNIFTTSPISWVTWLECIWISKCNYLKVCLCSKYAVMCPASRNRTSAPGHISVRSAYPSLGTYASSLAHIAIIRDVSTGTVKFRRWVHSSMIPCMNSTASSSRQRDTLSLTFSELETNIIYISCIEIMSMCYLNSSKYSLYRLHKTNQHHGAGSFWETNTSSLGQEIPPILWTLKVHYCVHHTLPLVPEQNEYSPHPPILFNINFNIIFQSTPMSSKLFLFLKYCNQESAWIFYPCTDHLIILELMTKIISGEYKS